MKKPTAKNESEYNEIVNTQIDIYIQTHKISECWLLIRSGDFLMNVVLDYPWEFWL